MKPLYFILASVFLLSTSNAAAEQSAPWELPLEVSDKNTNVRFDVDSTWHMVTGKIKGSSGFVKLSDPSNPLSVVSEIHFPVKSIKTGMGMRDSSLQDHMKADEFPEIVFKSEMAAADCDLSQLSVKPCKGKLIGELSIVDVTRKVELDIEIAKKNEVYEVSGKSTFAWADYHVEDPSILVAKVDPNVTVSYSLTLPSSKEMPEESTPK